MTVINQNDLETIKYRISNRIEPQTGAFKDLLSKAESQLNFQPDAPTSMDIMGGYEPNSNLSEMREWLWRNSHAAYTCGLAYALTGEVSYAEKAMEVLMDWANKGTEFTGGDRGLQLGSWFSPMLYAADLIWDYQGWTETDRDKFKSWWRQNCLLDGDVLDVMRRKDNNWKDAGLLGVMTAAVVLEDTLLLKEGLIQLKSYFFSRTDEYVRMPGKGWKIRKSQDVVFLPREVIRNDGRSGLTYTAYALTTMVQAFEIARYAGFNFWEKKTQEGASIKDVINQYYRWDIKREPFPWNSSPNYTEKRRNCYELSNTHFQNNEEFSEWVKTNWPVTNGREGDEYCALTKGDILGSGILPPEPPANLTGVPISDKKILITWQDNSNSETGFRIERRTLQSSYFSIATVAANTEGYEDSFLLTDSTTYIYRVVAYNDFAISDYSNECTVTTLPVSVNTDFNISENHDLLLGQNYPNPFNPTTQIKFRLPASGFTSLIIYDIMGNQVSILLERNLTKGSHTIVFNTENLSSGVYFYRILFAGSSITKKMIISK